MIGDPEITVVGFSEGAFLPTEPRGGGSKEKTSELYTRHRAGECGARRLSRCSRSQYVAMLQRSGCEGGRVVAIPAECKVCERPMRPSYVKPAERPGTVPHNARGLCAMCYRRAHRVPRIKPRTQHYVALTGIAEVTSEQRRLVVRQIQRLAPDDEGMLAAALLGPMRS